MSALQDLLNEGAAAAEQFAADNRDIDRAWRQGRLTEWLGEKIADDFNSNSGPDSGATVGNETGSGLGGEALAESPASP